VGQIKVHASVNQHSKKFNEFNLKSASPDSRGGYIAKETKKEKQEKGNIPREHAT